MKISCSSHEADALRMMVLNSSYRNPLTFGDEVIAQAERALERLRSALRPALPGAKGAPPASLEALAKAGGSYQSRFYRLHG